jgi:SAM-dependent methyltransferase
MPDLEWNRVTWNEPRQWRRAGDDWSDLWGGPHAQWYGAIFPRIARWLPVGRILEIAPGFGRWTQFLLGQSSEYYGVDFSPVCVEHCSERFATSITRTHFVHNDGRSLSGIPDNSIDFVFSYDSLVHVELDIIGGYCEQINTKLSERGIAFLHHSNALMGVDNTEVLYPQRGRATSVSSAKVKEFIERSGGKTLIQEEINWQSNKRIDCFTTFSKHASYAHFQYRLIENDNFMAETELIRSSISQYYGPCPNSVGSST